MARRFESRRYRPGRLIHSAAGLPAAATIRTMARARPAGSANIRTRSIGIAVLPSQGIGWIVGENESTRLVAVRGILRPGSFPNAIIPKTMTFSAMPHTSAESGERAVDGRMDARMDGELCEG